MIDRFVDSLAGKWVLGIIGVGAALWGWYAYTNSGTDVYFPPVQDVMGEVREYWFSAEGAGHLVASLTNLALGLGAAIIIGAALGMALGQFPVLERALSPELEFARAIPATALIPFAMMLFGIGIEMKTFLIFLGCLWPILINTIDGARRVDPTLLDTVAVYGITGISRQIHVVLPAVAPRIASGIRIAIPIGLILMVTSEMVGSTEGIGFVITSAQATFQLLLMWSGIVVLGVLGFIISTAFSLIERRVLSWSPAQHDQAR